MAITKSPPNTDERVTSLVDTLTLSTLEVADWHFLDLTLKIDRNRPLVNVLFEMAFSLDEPAVDLRAPTKDLAIA